MAVDIFQIPLENIPQKFDLQLGETLYTMTCKFNDADQGGWVLDIADGNSGESIVANIPLITGLDCLAGLGYLGFTGSLFVYTDGDPLAVPTFENLGVESNLYFVSEVA
jgi:hypothetical protein